MIEPDLIVTEEKFNRAFESADGDVKKNALTELVYGSLVPMLEASTEHRLQTLREALCSGETLSTCCGSSVDSTEKMASFLTKHHVPYTYVKSDEGSYILIIREEDLSAAAQARNKIEPVCTILEVRDRDKIVSRPGGCIYIDALSDGEYTVFHHSMCHVLRKSLASFDHSCSKYEDGANLVFLAAAPDEKADNLLADSIAFSTIRAAISANSKGAGELLADLDRERSMVLFMIHEEDRQPVPYCVPPVWVISGCRDPYYIETTSDGFVFGKTTGEGSSPTILCTVHKANGNYPKVLDDFVGRIRMPLVTDNPSIGSRFTNGDPDVITPPSGDGSRLNAFSVKTCSCLRRMLLRDEEVRSAPGLLERTTAILRRSTLALDLARIHDNDLRLRPEAAYPDAERRTRSACTAAGFEFDDIDELVRIAESCGLCLQEDCFPPILSMECTSIRPCRG